MSAPILLTVAILPAVILIVFVYKMDKVEKEPIGLIIGMFLLGGLSGVMAALLESLLMGLFEAIIPAGAVLLVVEYFIGVAAVEEGCKYLFLSTVRKRREFNYVFDGIVYAVAVALGFATLENIAYVFDGGIETAMMRAVFAVPGHFADGVVMGCFFGLARYREVRGNKKGARAFYWLAFLLPVIEHGFYDASLSSENDLLTLLALGVELAFIIIGIVLVRKFSRKDAAFYGEGAPMGAQVPSGAAGAPMPPAGYPQQGQVMPGQQYPQYPQQVRQQYQQQYQQQYPQQQYQQQYPQPGQQYPQQQQQSSQSYWQQPPSDGQQ